ncbi:iron transport multicopper oxidase [Clohesyomyces aquaticus]|uniref:Iron transport multicopper oxidase n=1 Tax=Clohesyomyces aquaticus TaxID=1231657 RepID=A0A1Y1ZHU6_9PLEO|nr:iron transport multicopper oxidase [Clohesyomyces aquaticus]
MLRTSFLLASLGVVCRAATVNYNWDITWVNAAPDGYSRPVIGINGAWPGPKIEANVGDTINVRVTNRLGNETTGIHWHGMYQTGSGTMDGPVRVGQCPIFPGDNFVYTFTANPAGSFWYHSHDSGQYPDGLRGPMVIHDPVAEARLNFTKEYTMTVSDWYHQQMPAQVHYYLSPQNTIDHDGAEPIPDATLINDKMTETFQIQPGKRYLIRIISMSALAAHYVKFDGHQMQVVAVDGVQVHSAPTDTILISAAQRYDVIITGLADPQKKNYAFVASFDPDMFDYVPTTLNMNNDGILQYDPTFAKPAPIRQDTFTGVLDDITLVPYDNQAIFGTPDQTITLNAQFKDYAVGSRAQLGSTPYIGQKVPTIFTAMTTGSDAENPIVYGETVNPYVLKQGQVIQIVLNNIDGGGHPFHLHGHNFQVLSRTTTQPWDGNTAVFPQKPMRRDTVKVPGGGSIVLRFVANNPGVFLFHCHIEWHVESGLSVTFIEAPLQLQKIFPQGVLGLQRGMCKKNKVPTDGNCAGNTKTPLDTSQCVQPLAFDPNPWGALINPPSARRSKRRARDALRARSPIEGS